MPETEARCPLGWAPGKSQRGFRAVGICAGVRVGRGSTMPHRTIHIGDPGRQFFATLRRGAVSARRGELPKLVGAFHPQDTSSDGPVLHESSRMIGEIASRRVPGLRSNRSRLARVRRITPLWSVAFVRRPRYEPLSNLHLAAAALASDSRSSFLVASSTRSIAPAYRSNSREHIFPAAVQTPFSFWRRGDEFPRNYSIESATVCLPRHSIRYLTFSAVELLLRQHRPFQAPGFSGPVCPPNGLALGIAGMPKARSPDQLPRDRLAGESSIMSIWPRFSWAASEQAVHHLSEVRGLHRASNVRGGPHHPEARQTRSSRTRVVGCSAGFVANEGAPNLPSQVLVS